MPTVTLDHATTVHYTEHGRGNKCIVLLHGFPLDSRIWDDVLRQPIPDARVIVPDLPGFGQSTAAKSFTIESLADEVQRLLVKLNVCPVILGGLSMGGYVALAYAKKYPMDLAGLMLIDTRAEADSAEGKAKREKMLAMIRERGPDAPGAVAEQMLPNLISKSNSGDQKLVASLQSIMRSCRPATLTSAVQAMRDREDQTDFLPSIALPTLIAVGADDAITPPSAAEAMNTAIPRSKLVKIPDAGHMSCMEKPEAVRAAMIDFVRTL